MIVLPPPEQTRLPYSWVGTSLPRGSHDEAAAVRHLRLPSFLIVSQTIIGTDPSQDSKDALFPLGSRDPRKQGQPGPRVNCGSRVRLFVVGVVALSPEPDTPLF